MKVKIRNTCGRSHDTEILNEQGVDICRSMRVLWPIDIHIDENDMIATLRILVDEIEIETLAEMIVQPLRKD